MNNPCPKCGRGMDRYYKKLGLGYIYPVDSPHKESFLCQYLYCPNDGTVVCKTCGGTDVFRPLEFYAWYCKVCEKV